MSSHLATKILWGQIMAVCAVTLTFLWGATEWTTWKLAFQPEPGPPWFEFLGWPFYLPPHSRCPSRCRYGGPALEDLIAGREI